MSGRIRVIEAEGSHYDVGLRIGQETREKIRELVALTPRALADDAETQRRCAAYLEHMEPYARVIDEIQGMADGAGLAFDQIVRMQIVELDRRGVPAEGCSTLVVRAGDRLLIGHNEDGKSTDDVFVLRAAYDSGPSVLSVCYCASLPGHSLNINSHGLLTLCNALTARDRRMGEPKRLVCRRVMECAGIDETVELLRNTRRAQGQNWLLVQGERIVDVETSATEMHVREIEGNDYHCNNYLYEGMSPFEGAKPDGGTFTRSAEARKVMGSLRTIEDLHAALSSHENSPHCFCRHEQGRTLAAILVDCTEGRVWIGRGPRCEAEMVEFDFDSLR